MALPEFNPVGDLPSGVFPASMDEVIERFGTDQGPRHRCSQHLVHIYGLARSTGYLQRFILFGSYITVKPDPHDVDVILVMDDAFSLADCPIEARGLFEHAVAQVRYGASIFWIRPGLLMGECLADFIAFWQSKALTSTPALGSVSGKAPSRHEICFPARQNLTCPNQISGDLLSIVEQMPYVDNLESVLQHD